MHATEAADAHTTILQEIEDPAMQQQGTITIRSVIDSASAEDGSHVENGSDALASALFSLYYHGLRMSETCWASEKMVEFAAIAAAEFTEDDMFDPAVLPMDYGLLLFETSYETTDVRGDPFFVDGFMWRTAPPEVRRQHKETRDGVLLYTLIDNRKHPLRSITEAKELIDSSTEGDELWQALVPPTVDRAHYHIQGYHFLTADDPMEGVNNLDYETKVLVGKARGIDPEDIPDSLATLPPLFYTIMLLMSQTLTTVTAEPPPRPARRRMERLNLKPRVTVIELRKRKSIAPRTATTASGKRYTKWRWLVRGHWRWIEDKDNPGQKRRVYVSHYFKGDEDAPLLVSHKVHALLR